MDYTSESSELVSAISTRIADNGAGVAEAIAKASDATLEWLGYLHASEATGHCDEFLDGIRSLILETVASGAAGLHRSAIFSMRGQIDLLFSWLYFKDHPVEWERVERENEGYKLRGEAIDYLDGYYPDFKRKLSVMNQHVQREIADPYKILSAHIHSVGTAAIPNLTQFADVVASKEVCSQLAGIQANVSDYCSDILISAYGGKWASLPSAIIVSVKKRLPEEKLAIVCA